MNKKHPNHICYTLADYLKKLQFVKSLIKDAIVKTQELVYTNLEDVIIENLPGRDYRLGNTINELRKLLSLLEGIEEDIIIILYRNQCFTVNIK